MTDVPKPAPVFAVVRDAPAPISLRGAVTAIGNFDGVHRGHRTVIAAAQARAAAIGCLAAALTFEPHPRTVLRPDQPFFRLSDETTKLRLLAATGLAGAFIVRFDAALASLPADVFVQEILIDRLGIAGAVIGFNFHFGSNREGSPQFLEAEGARRGFAVDVLPQLEDEGRPVSSQAVRAALAGGRMVEAAELLGYPWLISGTVIHGDKRGRDLGYPTANICPDPACGLRHGIYAVRVGVGGRRYDGVASFGRRPMYKIETPLLEAFLFDFNGDLYGLTIDVAFLAFVRDEMRFDSAETLVRRMDEDSRIAREALARSPDAFPPLGELAG
ncbi:MAG: bifunctional riboflavin kinase/FAD synthetase [Rhizobiales bacterium]|nr:bifunctional riboflavin kinase/FAD synthetase [Hyphomicrobiales bacterium]